MWVCVKIDWYSFIFAGSIGEIMRGIDTQVRKNRRRIFKEVANLAYTSQNLKDDVEALPYKIVDYDESEYESIYRERAIVREQIRLAMGLSLRPENMPDRKSVV